MHKIQKKCNFRLETKFSDVVALYYLDVDLRNILMRYINRLRC
nr:Abi family protein [Capnocytophaga bilenii]